MTNSRFLSSSVMRRCWINQTNPAKRFWNCAMSLSESLLVLVLESWGDSAIVKSRSNWDLLDNGGKNEKEGKEN
jgi:hypothetical protein